MNYTFLTINSYLDKRTDHQLLDWRWVAVRRSSKEPKDRSFGFEYAVRWTSSN